MSLALSRSRTGRRVALALLPATLVAPVATLAATPASADDAMVPHVFYQTFSPANPTPSDTITTTTSISGCAGSWGAPVTFFVINGPTYLGDRDYGSFSPDGDTYTVTHTWAPGTFLPGTYTLNGYGGGSPCFSTSSWSDPVTMVVATLPAVPDAPTVTAGQGSVGLSWAAPSNNGAAIGDYTVQYSSDNGATWTTDTAPASASTSRTVSGLANGTAYVFRIAATNVRGTSDYSDSSVAVTPRAAPAAPAAVSASPGEGSAELTITPGADGGSPITGYEVSTDDGDSFAPLSTTGSGPVTGTVSGLTNATSYALQVRAVNAIGTGPAATAAAVTPATVPATPSAPDATAGDGSVGLSWAAPANNGAAITDYTAQYSSDNGATWTTDTAPASTATTRTVTGLSNGTGYVFRIAAVNSRGAGSYSPASDAVTPQRAVTVPTAPRNLSAVSGDRAMVLGFDAPSSNGGSPVLGYDSSIDGGTSWQPLTTSGTGPISATLTGLQNNHPYSVLVRARNAQGNSPAAGPATGTPRSVVPVTINGPAATTSTPGSTVTIAGTAPAGSTVHVYFHQRNGDGYTKRRTLTASDAGTFSTTYLANDDYRYYAVAGDQRSPSVLNQLTPTVQAPAEQVVRRGSTVTLRGKANPNSTVRIHFHKQFTPYDDYSIVRIVPTAADGSWTRPYDASLDYRLFVTSDANGQASPGYLIQAR